MRKFKYLNESFHPKEIILMIIFSFVVLFFIFTEIGQEPIIILAAIISYIVFVVILCLTKNKIRQKNIAIKRYGLAYPANIVNFKKEVVWRNWKNGRVHTRINYHLYIKYTKNNEEYFFLTPATNFRPDELGSKICTVYVYNGEIYATDFIERAPKQKSIWYTEEELEQIYNNKAQAALTFIIFFLLFMILIVFG